MRTLPSFRRFCFGALALMACGGVRAQGPEDQGLVVLARTYKNMMFSNDPTKEALAQLKAQCPAEVAAAQAFVVQTITPKNDLLDAAYLHVPEAHVLWQLYTIRELSNDMRDENRVGDQPLIESLRRSPPARPVLVASYYGMLTAGVSNKNKPFDLAKLDLRLDTYGLLDDTERGIAFLEFMDMCRMSIWGYMNIVKPANTKEAQSYIKRYPKVNGAPYFQFNDLAFRDFQFMYDDSLQSYKGVMVGGYLELLLYHYIVLKEQGAKEDAVNALLLGSAMRDESLYKYTKYRDVFEGIFQKQRGDK